MTDAHSVSNRRTHEYFIIALPELVALSSISAIR